MINRIWRAREALCGFLSTSPQLLMSNWAIQAISFYKLCFLLSVRKKKPGEGVREQIKKIQRRWSIVCGCSVSVCKPEQSENYIYMSPRGQKACSSKFMREVHPLSLSLDMYTVYECVAEHTKIFVIRWWLSVCVCVLSLVCHMHAFTPTALFDIVCFILLYTATTLCFFIFLLFFSQFKKLQSRVCDLTIFKDCIRINKNIYIKKKKCCSIRARYHARVIPLGGSPIEIDLCALQNIALQFCVHALHLRKNTHRHTQFYFPRMYSFVCE